MIPKYASNPVPAAHVGQLFTIPEVVGRFVYPFKGMWQTAKQRRARSRMAFNCINVQGHKSWKFTMAPAFVRFCRRTRAGPIRKFLVKTFRRIGFGHCRAPRCRLLASVVP